MKLNRVGAYICSALMTVSCHNNYKPATDKALEQASKYLRGTELVVAEEKASYIAQKDGTMYVNQIFYWDSVLCVNKEQEAFKKGVQHIKDSMAGNYRRKLPLQISLEPKTHQKTKRIVDSVKKEVSQYCNGEEMLNLERKAPKVDNNRYLTTDGYVTHYFGTLAIQGAERKGFNDGLIEGRKKLGTKK